MDLEQCTAGVIRGVTHSLSKHTSTYLVQRHGKITFVSEHRLASDNEVKLGHIIFGPGGAKLQAIQTIHILPGYSQSNLSSSTAADPRCDKYQLDPASDDRVEIILLRHGDIITSPNATDSVACVFRGFEVQVNSSAAKNAKDGTSGKNVEVGEAPDDELEEVTAPDGTVTEVPVTQTVTQPLKSQRSGTPRLPRDKSLVVHETPTTSRVAGVDEYTTVTPNENQRTASNPQETNVVTETFSTARAGHSPKINAQHSIAMELVEPALERELLHSSPEARVNGQRTRKRTRADPLPNLKVELATESRSVKRVKKAASANDSGGDIDHISPIDDIDDNSNHTTCSTKGKGQSRIITDVALTEPSISSQRSETGLTVAAYEGDPPRVATSNSAIKEGSSTLKFLRRHGGTFLSTVDDRCNILCVRDGGLAKTMKVFQAIALGIPIVTDKWLSDSAKADGFLDLSSYKPSVAQQEQEWGFSFEKVWGTAQTPFKGYCIYFTPALRKTYTNFREMQRVCQAVGAEVITKRPSKNDRTIVLATEEDDPDAEKMIFEGETCYHKDLVTSSILRGKLDLEGDEFKIRAKHVGISRRKVPRKST